MENRENVGRMNFTNACRYKTCKHCSWAQPVSMALMTIRGNCGICVLNSARTIQESMKYQSRAIRNFKLCVWISLCQQDTNECVEKVSTGIFHFFLE